MLIHAELKTVITIFISALEVQRTTNYEELDTVVDFSRMLKVLQVVTIGTAEKVMSKIVIVFYIIFKSWTC